MKLNWRASCATFRLLFLLFAFAFALAQGNPPPDNPAPKKPQPQILMWTPPEHPSPPFGSVLRKVVSVVRESCKDADGKIQTTSGTGFIVAYHDPRLAPDLMFDYLVTNRHVAECQDEERRPREVLSAGLQVNLTDGRTTILQLNDHGNAAWRFPADDSVDLAVVPIVIGTGLNFRPYVIPLDLFFLKEDLASENLGEGAKIILSGYFYQIDGSPRLEPLVREGVLSMIPETPLTTTMGKPGTIYLGDIHIFGGNSGSPVFISSYGVRPRGPVLDDEFHFLGVVSGYYYEDSDFKLQIAITVSGKQRANSGISMIVPADFLKDLILNNPELKRAREANFPAAQAKK
jgi:Trypsin-like peptidase domain